MSIPYRQVHLDFHTSEHIPHVAKDFDKEVFAHTLKQASVDSVTCFARCHHGWLYYPSIHRPDLIHPNLENKRLLLEQIESCHAQGIAVPIYTTVQWDAYIAREHPEWLCVDENGNFINTQNVDEPHFYYTICLNSEYRTYFIQHLYDVIEVVGVENIDGFFLDILFEVDCHCPNCMKQMERLEYDVTNKTERLRYSRHMLHTFKNEIATLVRAIVPDAHIFFNSSHVGPALKESIDAYSHLELESLPSGGWGYDHFPATIRYARQLGKDVLGMTGKFHTYWGDFHSLKNQAALEYECLRMIASGAGISIGDQLHPNGVLSEGAYKLIGDLYTKVARIEPYCKEAVNQAEIAIITPEEQQMNNGGNLGIDPSLIGTVRMLEELSYQFDIIDSTMDFSKYALIIIPDHILCHDYLVKQLTQFKKNGGKLLVTGKSLANNPTMMREICGVKWEGPSTYDRSFILPNDCIGKGLYQEEYVMYDKGYRVEEKEAEVCMHTVNPYFNREGDTYCSHQHAPSSKEIGPPAVTKFNETIYVSYEIFKIYRQKAPNWCKAIIKDILELLLENKMVTHNGPSSLRVYVQENKNKQMTLVHFLHYITEKKAEDLYTIEEYIPLSAVHASFYSGTKSITSITRISDQQSISFEKKNGYTSFLLDELHGYDMYCIEWEE
ncbi:beta-galactosidase trimerization domain-containing protein [Gracilibacillus marinus]|uniref:Beta-galactosidase trimerization domain-containing protein n=1 Tax=Gracilibacillus marinus TaxID=630535 RepID=A0ABV8VRP5_9BACI